MKKLFFFKSSASSNGNSNPAPPVSKDKQVYWENTAEDGLTNQATWKPRAKKNVSETQTFGNGPFLRRSRSYSSGSVHDGGLVRNQSGSPCSSSSNVSLRQSDRHLSGRALTPERPSRAKWFEDAAVCNSPGVEKFDSATSVRTDNVSSEISSYCSTNASNKVLDRYIDGEQDKEMSSTQINSSARGHGGNANGGGKRPPRVQYTAPSSPSDGLKQKPRSHSFRELSKESHLYNSCRDWVENGYGHESPRKLAKHVIERLSQSRNLPRASSKDFEPDIPITIEDIYGGSIQRCPSLPPDGVSKEISSFLERNCCPDDDCRVLDHDDSEEDVDQVAEMASAKDEVRLLRAELESRTRRLEKEKNEMQLALEKELDRRSSEWSSKLEKYQAEEHRLRERVRELAEQNVSLQREVSSFGEREMDSRSRLTYSDLQLKDLMSRVEQVTEENQNLQQNLSELEEKFRAAEEDRDCFRRNYEDKEKESKELNKAITRLLRTCSEQEKTIDGLREGLSKEARKNSVENCGNNQLAKLQMEQMRLTGVEQALRKEVESYRVEVDYLRHENISLLQRLKGNSTDGGFSTLKLEQEVLNRVRCLQNQGMCLLNESTQLCTKLLENIKARACHSSETKQGIEAIKNGLDSQLLVESEVKLQGFKRGAENLSKGLQSISTALHEKSYKVCARQSHSSGDGSEQLNNQSLENVLKSDLKAEASVTILLREKLFFKEVDIEQLHAELAAAVRGNDILRCELQNAMDEVSCITHKMKDLELQMIKKDESIYQLQNDLQDCRKELTIVNGILPKVSEERDMMWEEVKQYSENNMLLNSEVGMLKKKIEALDEDVLLKEGQITILKDALKKPFDLLSTPISTQEFLLE